MFEGNDPNLDGLVLCVLMVGKGNDVGHIILLTMHLQDIAKTKAKDRSQYVILTSLHLNESYWYFLVDISNKAADLLLFER